MRRSFVILSVLAILAAPEPAGAAWPSDPTVNLSLCTEKEDQFGVVLIADGAGGALAAWWDKRGGGADIYAQRIDASGTHLWAPGGTAVCQAPGDQFTPRIARDGAGGMIVAWEDRRAGNTDIWAQRLDAGGIVQWDPDGVELCGAGGEQLFPSIAPDGAGGAFVTWEDQRTGLRFDVYAQRVGATGTIQWTADGVAVSAFPLDELFPVVVPDGAGGAIIAWEDLRTGVTTADIYAQRVDAKGTLLWGSLGVAVCDALDDQANPRMITDGDGGAILTWFDNRDLGGGDIYGQRIDATGTTSWTEDGEPLCAAVGIQRLPRLVGDGEQGAIVVWDDERSGSSDVYAQRVNGTGASMWTPGGVGVCTDPADQYQHVFGLAPDGAGGAIVTWQDYRPDITNSDVYARRVAADGNVQWAVDGVPVCSAPNTQTTPVAVADGSGGVIVVWGDYRTGNVPGNADLYMQRVGPDGSLGGVTGVAAASAEPGVLSLRLASENPTAWGARLRYTLGDPSRVRLDILDVGGRTIRTLDAGARDPGAHILRWDGHDRSGRAAPSGVYLVRLAAGARTEVERLTLVR